MTQRTRQKIIDLFLAGRMPRHIHGFLDERVERQDIYHTIECARRKGVVPRRGIWGRPKRAQA